MDDRCVKILGDGSVNFHSCRLMIVPTGTVSQGGYLACQRCKIVGRKLIDERRRKSGPGATKYLHGSGAMPAPRTDSEWPSYVRPQPPSTDDKMRHVRNPNTPFHKRLQCKMVTTFVVDLMHTGHAGALRQAVQYLFGIDLPVGQISHRFTMAQIDAANLALDNWKKCFPREINRQPRKLELLQKWKMRECYMTGTRCIPVLQVVPRFKAALTQDQLKYFSNYMHLVVALRIVSSNRMEPISEVRFQTQGFHCREL